jgi:hypothetical protein
MGYGAWVPAGVDVNQPNAARMYDYLLGGSHNFPVDRAAAEAVRRLVPDVASMAVHNRAFLRRAVRFLARSGIRQFLDLGSGIPTAGNVHEVAQDEDPSCRVVYVDIEPVAVGHARSILAGNDLCAVVQADLRDVDRVLGDPAVRALLDPSRPVALLALTVLHLLSDVDDAVAAIGRYRDWSAGGYLAVSHASADGLPPERAAALARVTEVYERTSTPFRPRPVTEIARFFQEYHLVEPGLVRLPQWRPDEERPPTADAAFFGMFVGVGRR